MQWIKKTEQAKDWMGSGMAAEAAKAALDIASKTADKVTDVAASASGFMMEKGLTGLGAALDFAIEAIDKPFADVGKDIFNDKKDAIIECYCTIIDGEKFKITDPQNTVRGKAPWGEAEYKACDTSNCVRLMQNLCLAEQKTEMLKIVQDRINEHIVTRVWNDLIKAYEKCIEALNKITTQYEILKGLEREPFKLDLGEYIVHQTIVEFYKLMMDQEAEIRKEPSKFAKKTKMPEVFPLLFSGNPAYDAFTLSHYANMERNKFLGVPEDRP